MAPLALKLIDSIIDIKSFGIFYAELQKIEDSNFYQFLY